MSLRLDKLTDRTPVPMSISVDPNLDAALTNYSEIYGQTYGPEEKPEALIPSMFETFLGSDAGFKRAQRTLHANQRD